MCGWIARRKHRSFFGFFLISLLLAKSVYGAFTTGEVGIRSTTYNRETEPASFWLATLIQVGLLFVALAVFVASYRQTP